MISLKKRSKWENAILSEASGGKRDARDEHRISKTADSAARHRDHLSFQPQVEY